MDIRTTLKLASLTVVLLPPSPGHALQGIETWPDAFLRSPIELRDAVGSVHDPVTTSSATARAYHEQGLALYYLFDYHDAVRSFHAALSHDPNLAVAHLGMSLALERLGRTDFARRALTEAEALAHHAGAAERARIAVRVELARVRDGDAPQEAYVSALENSIARFPDDTELRMELVRRAGDVDVRIARLYDLLAVAPDHIGGLHKLAHQYETVGDYSSSAELGRRIAELAPSVPHALQMAAYYLPRLGRAEEGLEWLEAADRLERTLIDESGLPGSVFPSFRMNLHLLSSSYWQVGRTEASVRLLREYIQLTGDPAGVTRATLVDMQVVDGRTDEALAAARRLVSEADAGNGSVPIARATLASTLVAVGDFEGARSELDHVEVPEGPLGLSVETRIRRVEAQLLFQTGDRAEGAEALLSAAREAGERASGLEWFRPRLELETLFMMAAALAEPELMASVRSILLEVDPSYVGAGTVMDRRGELDRHERAHRLAHG